VAKERILITVKTYPTLSTKYGETVCTAGVREDGSWVRLYPVPFRRLGEQERYRKYDWVECSVVRHTADPRPESFRPVDPEELTPVDHVEPSANWRERRRLLLDTCQVFTNLDELILAAKANRMSLGLFRPIDVQRFYWKAEDERDWNPKKLKEMRAAHAQGELFDEESWRKTFRVIPKLPYSFHYRFADAAGKVRNLQILDWEIGALYWNCLRDANGDEISALEKVKATYWNKFLEKDLHFYLGTTQQFHRRAPNPWVIIGVLPIPVQRQRELF
jgi:hypothetical protein